jgi:hypothetical protein
MSSFQTLIDSPEFLRHLNEDQNTRTQEQTSDLEDVDTIPDLIFSVEEYLDDSCEQFDGLRAYPNPGAFELHSLRSPR